MILETINVGPMEVNCYILASGKNSKAIIIDPGDQERKIREALDKHQLTPAFIVNTHGHYDHIGCDDKFGVPVYIHHADEAFLKDPNLNLSGLFASAYQVNSEIKILKEGDMLELDDLQLEVLHIPGHTQGGIALRLRRPTNKIVFTGDSLFQQGIGRSDLPGGDEDALVNAIKEKLLTLPPDTIIYPGHGASSTVRDEIKSNPFLT